MTRSERSARSPRAVGLIAMLWFTLGLALLLRRYEGELPWRSLFLAGAGSSASCRGRIASWDAAVYRSDDIEQPQVARYASTSATSPSSNGWVAAGACRDLAPASIVLGGTASCRSGSAGGRCVSPASARCSAPRRVDREATRSSPFVAFWVWVAVLSVTLVLGRISPSTDHEKLLSAWGRAPITTRSGRGGINVADEQVAAGTRSLRTPGLGSRRDPQTSSQEAIGDELALPDEHPSSGSASRAFECRRRLAGSPAPA